MFTAALMMIQHIFTIIVFANWMHVCVFVRASEVVILVNLYSLAVQQR